MKFWWLIYAAAAAQALLLAPALWQQRARLPANRLLAVWLAIVGIDLALRTWALGLPADPRVRVSLLTASFPFLHASLFYLYVRCAARGTGLQRNDWLHGLGFLLSALALANLQWLPPEELARQRLEFQHSLRALIVFDVGLLAWGIGYVSAALLEIARQRKSLLSTRSDGDPETLTWLQQTAWWQSTIWSVALAHSLLPPGWVPFPLIYTTVAAWVLAIGYRALWHTRTTEGGTAHAANSESAGAEPAAGDSSQGPTDATTAALDDPRQTEVERRLRALMEDEQLYRQPALSIVQLAKRAGYPEYLVSLVINRSFGVPFWDFVNRYRVQAAQACLLDPDERRTALDIAYDCGFTSKSTFNSAFKRLLGETPSQVRGRASAAPPSIDASTSRSTRD